MGEEFDAALRLIPNVVEDGVPPGARTTTSCSRRSAPAPSCPRAWTPGATTSNSASCSGHRHRARRQGLGVAVLLLPHRRRGPAGTGAAEPGRRQGRRERVHPDDHADAGEAGGHGGHRVPRRARGPRCTTSRRTTSTSRGRARSPSPGTTPTRSSTCPRVRSGTRAGRPATAARPGRTARTPAASSASTSSTRSRCSRSAAPRTPRPSTSGCWAGEGHARRDRGALPGHRHRGRRPRQFRARKYDCEAWVPTQGTYRELSSTSNCTTFQSRRLGVRERLAEGSGTRPVATLNGTLATTRWLVASWRTTAADGSVRVPAALQPFLGWTCSRPVG